ncbi:MAG: hypothetical protein JWL79_3893 [Frankiales bacterium]|nr:hypothetical protein [Frankiales bacterium]
MTLSAPAPSGARTLFQSTRRKLGMSKASASAALAVVCLAGLGAVISPSPLAVFGSGVALAALFLLLWQDNEPPILLFPAIFQWLAVAMKPLMTIYAKVPLDTLSEYDQRLEPGVYLGLFAVVALGLGLRVGAGKPKIDWNTALRNEAAMVTRESMLKVAVGAIALGHAMYFLMRFAGPLYQLAYAGAGARFIGLFALAYWAFSRGSGYFYLFLVLVVEVGIGVTGFFSDFKAPIFVVGFAILAARHRIRFKDVAILGALSAVLIVMGSFWSYVKVDYRTYASGGTNEQVLNVSLSDRLDYLGNEIAHFDGTRFAAGLDQMLRRLSYIDFLAATIDHVPDAEPFEHGARIGRTLIHIITPRVFFPDKPPTEFDTDVTLKYTGLPLRSYGGTSISIGYLGELYIDFGPVGSVIGCFLVAAGFGLAYRLIRGRSNGSVLLLYGVRSMAVLTILPFDIALIKYIGGATTAFIAAYLLQRYVLPRLSRRLRWQRPAAAAPPAYRPGYAV